MKTSDKLIKIRSKNSKLTPCLHPEEGSLRLTPRNAALKHYSVMQFEYMNSVFSQDIERVVRLISYNPLLFYFYRSQPIYMLISETVKILMMSLIEAIVYCEILSYDLQKHLENSADVFLAFVGYSVKKFFSTNLSIISEYLDTKFVKFSQNFENWEKNCGLSLNFSIKELNSLFEKHRKGSFEVNLSYYIDRVLQISPPYQIESKETLKFILSDFEDSNKDVNFDKAYEKIASIFDKYEFVKDDKPTVQAKPHDPFLAQISNRF